MLETVRKGHYLFCKFAVLGMVDGTCYLSFVHIFLKTDFNLVKSVHLFLWNIKYSTETKRNFGD